MPLLKLSLNKLQKNRWKKWILILQTSLKQLWWEGLPLLSQQHQSLYSLSITKMKVWYIFTVFFLSKEFILLAASKPPSTDTQPFWMDKDVFELIMKQKNKLLLKEKTLRNAQKGGSSRRLNHKAAQRDSTTGLPTNMHVWMC